MVRRRTLLTGIAAVTVGIGGCSGDGAGSGGEDGTTSDGSHATTAAPSSTATDAPTTTADEFGTAPPVQETVGDEPIDTPAPQTTDAGGDFDDAFDITAAYGTAIENRTIGVVRLRLGVAPGIRIDTSTIRVRWIDPSGTYTVVWMSDNSSTDGYFGLRTIEDDNESAPVLDDPGDEIELVFDLGESDTEIDDPDRGTDHPGATSFASRLRGGSVVSVQLATGTGRSLTRRLEVPETLRGERRVELDVS